MKNETTINVYTLAKLITQYNGKTGTANQLSKLAKQIIKTPIVYINFAQQRNLIK